MLEKELLSSVASTAKIRILSNPNYVVELEKFNKKIEETKNPFKKAKYISDQNNYFSDLIIEESEKYVKFLENKRSEIKYIY